MVKLAILREVSFEKKEKFDDLENSKLTNLLNDKVFFEEFENTPGMLLIVKNIFFDNNNPDPDIEIINCHYNSSFLVQAFFVDDESQSLHCNIVIVKRRIHSNDTYTFSEYKEDENKNISDPYEYVDVTMDDVCDIIKRKSVINCVIIKQDGEIIDDKLLFLNSNEDVGKIILQKEKRELLYLNIANLVTRLGDSDEANRLDEIINQKSHAYGAHHIFTQINSGLGILNCFCQSHAKNKNEIMTNLINHDIYGDAVLFLQSNYDGDKETFMDLDKELFNKLYKTIVNKKRIKRENPNFFNLYRELR